MGAPTEPEPASPIILMLSGGGHRASLFALGALMALVDRGLNRRVAQISSVSGGSLTNAFVASRCDFTQVTSAAFDSIAKDLVGTLRSKGVLRRWHICVYLIALSALGMGCLWLLLQRNPVAIALVSLFATVLTLRGLLLECLLRVRYFHALRFADLAPRPCAHVLCSTDLRAGQSIYVSSWTGGVIGQRYQTTIRQPGFSPQRGCSYSAQRLRLSKAVAASSAFPGLLPVRLSVGGKKYPRIGFIAEAPPTARLLLADGGIVNNLGTQALAEDAFFHGRFKDADAPPDEPYLVKEAGDSDFPQDHISLVVDASAPPTPLSPLSRVPLAGELVTLVRIARILFTNTIHPRIRALDDRAIYCDPLPAAYTHRMYRMLFLHNFCGYLNPDAIPDFLAARVPHAVSRIIAIADKTHGTVWARGDWLYLDPTPLTLPTTLGRIKPLDAVQLVARGYGSALAASLDFALFDQGSDGEFSGLGMPLLTWPRLLTLIGRTADPV